MHSRRSFWRDSGGRTAASQYTEGSMAFGFLVILLAAQDPGVAPEWDMKTRVEKLSAEVGRLKPVLEQLQPEAWTQKGAPEGYGKQWRFCLNEIGNVQASAKILQAKPEKLTAALDVYLRTESLLTQLGSLNEGVRRYQNPAVADLINGIAGATASNREFLRQQIQELAAVREQEMEVAEREAQRCRADIARPGPHRPKQE